MGKKDMLLINIGSNIKKKGKSQIIRPIILFAVLSTICCNSNQYSFDKVQQQIISHHVIVALDVLDLETGDIYFIKKSTDNTNGTKFMNLNSIPADYNVYKNMHNNLFRSKRIISPNRHYKVINISIGDAGRWKIELYSDSCGKLHPVPTD